MDELIRSRSRLLQGHVARRWIGLAVAWVVGHRRRSVVFRLPDQYEASARVYVDTQSMLRPLMAGHDGAARTSIRQVAILSRTLISRPNMEKLIRMADLDLERESKADRDAWSMRLMRSLKITRRVGDNLYTISYPGHRSPRRQARCVQSLVSIVHRVEPRRKPQGYRAARKFLDEQIKVYEKKLEEAEGRAQGIQDQVHGTVHERSARIIFRR